MLSGESPRTDPVERCREHATVSAGVRIGSVALIDEFRAFKLLKLRAPSCYLGNEGTRWRWNGVGILLARLQ